MRTEWREFEKFVARIEGILAPLGAIVTSPDKIPDRHGRKRQVDASIRFNIGSVPILITVECRRRSRKQDVEWIEQLATKRKNIGAAKTIAVASRGISELARETARDEGIETRIMSEVDEESVRKWIDLQSLTVYRLEWHLKGLGIEYVIPDGIADQDEDISAEILRLANERAPFFIRSEFKTPCTSHDLIHESHDSGLFRNSPIPFDGAFHDFSIVANYPPGALKLVCIFGEFPVSRISFDLEGKQNDVSGPLSKRSGRYQTTDDTIVDAAEWSMKLDKHELALSFQRNATGTVTKAFTLLDCATGHLQQIVNRGKGDQVIGTWREGS